MEFVTAISDHFRGSFTVVRAVEDYMRDTIRKRDGRRAARRAELGIGANEHLVILTAHRLLRAHLPQICTTLKCAPEDTLDELCRLILEDAGFAVGDVRRLAALDRVLDWTESLSQNEPDSMESFARGFAVVHHISPNLCPLFEVAGPVRGVQFIGDVIGFVAFLDSFLDRTVRPSVNCLNWEESVG
jgi:hypothetical protein